MYDSLKKRKKLFVRPAMTKNNFKDVQQNVVKSDKLNKIVTEW